jgi:hypothetical protein
MSKYTYGFEEWSRDTRRYTIECDRKLTRDEVNDAMYEVQTFIDLNEDDGTVHKLPLDDGAIAIVTYNGNEFGNSDSEITEGEEDLKDD